MKIMVVTCGPAQGSGVRTAASAMSGVLRSLGHDVMSLAVDARPRRAGNRVNVENVRSVLRDARTVASAVDAHGPEVVWIHSLGFPVLPAVRTLVLTAAVRRRAPVVSHLHAYGLHDRFRSDRLGRGVVGLLARAAAIVVVLDEHAAAAVGGALRHGTIMAVPNVVELPSDIEPLPSGDRLRLVYVGGLTKRKGVPELVEAFRQLDDSFELHLVGGAGEDGVEFARSVMASAADLGDRVIFEGELDDVGVRQQLRRADVFVLPSRAEGMPIALLEAMAEARPVLVSGAGGMGRIVASAGCGVVVEAIEPTSVAGAIRHLAARRADLRDMGARGRAAVEMAHASSAVAWQVQRVLATVLRRA